MSPPIAPVGLEYVARAAVAAGLEVQIADLCLAEDPEATLDAALAREPELIGISLRNVDDCFWPSAASFLPDLVRWIARIRRGSRAPVCLGGVGFSIFAREIVAHAGVEFGIRGDGELALVALVAELRGERRFDRVDGLVWCDGRQWHANRPAWPAVWPTSTARDLVANQQYFRRGGQIGLETKRGCDRQCAYCADPIAKGASVRARPATLVADEVESLLAQGIDVLHICDSEFNIPGSHARAVCEELVRRRLGERVRWYAYLAVLPFDAEMAALMRRAGCVGINFTGDAASASMLRRYGQPHHSADLANAIRWCRDQGITVMVDLLLGGPGETAASVAETIEFVRQAGPDCAGTGLGVRLYPGTSIVGQLQQVGPLETTPGLRRRYDGPIDLTRPTFFISPALGAQPAQLVRDLIAGDPRFFEPALEVSDGTSTDHNYNDNAPLVNAIAAGARGAYWDILRQLKDLQGS
jgi:radical SAM superfamily enzyme YgiQ (UPF0313 family)